MSFKPLDGDVSVIRSRAQGLTSAASAMGTAASQLANIQDYAGYSSGALKAVGDKVGDLREMVLKAQIRYNGAGRALSDYAEALHDAQVKAQEAIATHDGLQGALASAEARADDTRVGPFDFTATDEERADHSIAEAQLEDLRSQAGAAESKYHEAEGDRDRAAETAIKAIEAANDASDLDDSWWDKVSGWVNSLPWKEILATIKVVADFVALLTTVVGLVLMFTPLAPLGAALLAVGRIAALVSLAVTVFQVVRGEASWGEAAIGVLLLATGGIGKLLKGTGGALRGLGNLGNLGALARGLPGLLGRGARGVGSNLGRTYDGLRFVRDYRNMAGIGQTLRHFGPSDPVLWSGVYNQARNWVVRDGVRQYVGNLADNAVAGLGKGEFYVGPPGFQVGVDKGGFDVRVGQW